MKTSRILFNVLCFIFISHFLCAGTVTWIGGNGDWDVSTNWDTGIIPTALDDVIIPNGVVKLRKGDVAFAHTVHVQAGARLNVYYLGSLIISGKTTEASLLNEEELISGAISIFMMYLKRAL